MKRIISTLTMVLLMAGCSTVQTTDSSAAEAPAMDSRAAAAKLLDVLEMDKNFDAAMQQAVQMQSGMLDQMDMSAEEKEAAQKGMEKSMQPVLDKFSWENMKGMFVDIYAEVFTAEELQGIVEFYESPEGQKFVQKQPQLMQVTMQKMQALMAEMMPEIQKEMEQLVEEVEAEKTDSDMGM